MWLQRSGCRAAAAASRLPCTCRHMTAFVTLRYVTVELHDGFNTMLHDLLCWHKVVALRLAQP
jgi:hypothetical protein